MKAHRVRSVSAFNFVNFLNFFNSQEYFAEMGFHGFGLYRFLVIVKFGCYHFVLFMNGVALKVNEKFL